MLEAVEAAGSRNAEFTVTKDFVDLCGEKRKVGQPGRRFVHVDVWLYPREGRASEEGCRINDLELVILELGRFAGKDEAQLGEELAQLGGRLAIEGIRRFQLELFGALWDVRPGFLGESSVGLA